MFLHLFMLVFFFLLFNFQSVYIHFHIVLYLNTSRSIYSYILLFLVIHPLFTMFVSISKWLPFTCTPPPTTAVKHFPNLTKRLTRIFLWSFRRYTFYLPVGWDRLFISFLRPQGSWRTSTRRGMKLFLLVVNASFYSPSPRISSIPRHC